MEFVDVHNHLLSTDFDGDRDKVIKDAIAAGVKYSITVAESYDESVNLLEFSKNSDFVKACIGIYPANFDDFENTGKIIELIKENRNSIAGIGEVGLDFWKAKTDEEKQVQKEVFIRLVETAKELDLPLNIHSRSAGHYVIELLKKFKVKKVCMHAFDGKAKYAVDGFNSGYYFSIPTSVVHSQQKIKLIKNLPLEAMLAETDAPVLSPLPGTRNEPKNILKVIEKISEIKNMDIKETAAVLRENTYKLFGF
ncbi:TatD family hydrolase [candidate division KSB1 bacterium]